MARDFQLKLGVDLATFNASLQRGFASLRERAQIAFNSVRDAAGVALQNANQLAAGLQNVAAELQQVTAAGREFFSQASEAAAGDQLADFRIGAVFGEASKDVAAFTEELGAGTDRAVGDLRTLLSEFGAFTTQIGFTREESAALAQQVSRVALNFADLQNIGDKEAFGVIQQALAGQTRALRQYGISIDETDEKLKALELGFNPDALTDQEAATIRLSLVMDRLGIAAGATTERQQTFTGALRALQNQVGELFGDIGKFINEAAQPLIAKTTDVVKSIRAWISENPRLAQTLAVVGAGIIALLTVLSGMVGTAAAVISAIAGVSTAITALGGVAQIGATLMGIFTSACKLMEIALLSAAPALGVVGAAIAGWKVGRMADELLGLNASFERVRKGTASWVDYLKSYSVPILKVAADAAAALGERIGAAQRESVKKLETQNLERLVATFTQGSRELQTYNRLLRDGVPAYQAAILAANELNEIRFLEQKGAAATAIELQRLDELRARNTATLRAETAAQSESKTSTEQLSEARERLKSTEQQYAELVKATTLETIRARRGETVATITELRTQLQERRKFLQQRVDDELTLVRQLEQQKKTLQASTNQDGKNSTAQRAIESELNAHAANLQRIRDTMLAAEESFNANVKRVLQQRADVMRQESDKRIAEIQRESEAVQREYQSQLDALTSQIDRLKSARQSGQDDAARYIQSLQDASLRERNAVLANVTALENEIATKLKGNATDQTRAQLQEVGLQRLRATADMTAQLADEERKLSEAIAATNALPEGERFGSQSSRDIGRINARIDELKKLKAEVDAFVSGSADRLAAAATEGATNSSNADREIESLESQRLGLLESINQARREEVRLVRQVTEELRKQLELQQKRPSLRPDSVMTLAEWEEQKQSSLDSKPKQDQIVEDVKSSPSLYEQLNATPADEREAFMRRWEKEQEVKEQQAAADRSAISATQAAAEQAVQQNGAANSAITDALTTTGEALGGLAASGAQLLQHGQILPQISTVLTALRDDQIKFGQLLDQFGNVVIQKFTETQGVLATHSAKLSEHTQKLKELNMANGVVDARTAGL